MTVNMMKNGKEWDFVISEEGELKNTFDIFNDLSNVLINTCFFDLVNVWTIALPLKIEN